MEIGKRIRSYRERQGLTQGDLATHAHISRISLGNYERGERVPPVDIFLRIAQALHVSTDELLGYSPAKDPLQKVLSDLNSCGFLAKPIMYPKNPEYLPSMVEITDKEGSVHTYPRDTVLFIFNKVQDSVLYRDFKYNCYLTAMDQMTDTIAKQFYLMVKNDSSFAEIKKKILEQDPNAFDK